ncbi:replication-relaxation family protein [Amycolatopsis albispora]|uniref:replication-relaxation family protein n=1 Tax=Amycolatopsis albispora TaxID=1804986 RepID=UPI003002FA55
MQLGHTIGCNGLFTNLIRHSRQLGATGRLTAWWSATRCGRHWGDIVNPDGYGRWQQRGREVEWFVEFDFGTEQLSRLAVKLTRYARLAETTGITTPVLMWFPTAAREAHARQTLADAQRALDQPAHVPIATTSAETAADPLDMTAARWRPVGDTGNNGRTPLADLPTLWPGLPAPANLGDHRPASSDPTRPRFGLVAPSPLPPPSPSWRRTA